MHDIVKPHKHILAEPPSSPFAPRLKPLVEQQGSRYQLADWRQMDRWNPDRFVAEGLLPALNTHGNKEVNRSILILANTAAPPIKRTHATTHSRLFDWAEDIMSGSEFHAAGPVRMLLWCPEQDATTFMPHTIGRRSKLSLMLEMTCHIEEIVGSCESVTERQAKRDQVIEIESGKRVAKLMEKSGVTVPPGRETHLHQMIQEALTQSGGHDAGPATETTSIPSRSWHKELQGLRRRFKDVEIPQDQSGRRKLAKIPPEIVKNPAFARFLELERNLKHKQKTTGVVEELLQDQSQIDALYLQVDDPHLEEAQRTATLADIRGKSQNLRDGLENLSTKYRNEFEFFKHDRKAYAQNPPLLMWDHRSAEPLKAHKEEFYPAKGLCLLDIEPRHPFPYPMTVAQRTFFRLLTTTLWQNAWDNLRILDHIAPGAFDAVNPKVPSLRDPARGGERNIQDLPIRRLTPEMAHGLVKAWFDWPFRPDLAELLHRGSSVEVQINDVLRPIGGSRPSMDGSIHL